MEARGSEKRTVMSAVYPTLPEPGVGEIDSTRSGFAFLFGRTAVEPVCESETPMVGAVEDVVLTPPSAEHPPATTATARLARASEDRPEIRRPEIRRAARCVFIGILSNGSPPRGSVGEQES